MRRSSNGKRLTLFQHGLFEERLDKLIGKVEALAARGPEVYCSHPAAKRLHDRGVHPETDSPGDQARQSSTRNALGKDNRHWFRAKFHGRYRLFF